MLLLLYGSAVAVRRVKLTIDGNTALRAKEAPNDRKPIHYAKMSGVAWSWRRYVDDDCVDYEL